MKHTQEEIINALQVIKDVCNKNEKCVMCPLRSRGVGCTLMNTFPNQWEIKNNETNWRAFK